jgi:hypothetical protein
VVLMSAAAIKISNACLFYTQWASEVHIDLPRAPTPAAARRPENANPVL